MTVSLYAALLALIFIGLSVNVINGRKKFGIGLGDDNNIEMKRRIRAQLNLVEYAPMFIIMLAYAEYANLSLWLIHLLGIVFLTGRMMHAYSILIAEKYENNKLMFKPIWRTYGMICTLSTIALLAIIILLQYANFLH